MTKKTKKTKKTKCQFPECNANYVLIIGDCNFCNSKFCSTHRLPEEHSCQKMADCKKNSFERNKEKLFSEKTVGQKIVKIN